MANETLGERGDRAVRAYAYLTASFRAANDVNDVLDCIVPFVAKVALADATQPVDVPQITKSLEDFRLKIPRYAVQQLLPRLQKRGLLEWSAVSRSYIPLGKNIANESAEVALSNDFDSLESSIGAFAESLELPAIPFSTSWSEALIRFLGSEGMRKGMKPIVHKRAILSEFSAVENFVIARFIQFVSVGNRDLFDAISRVYSGVLIEDFVSNIQAIGKPQDYKGLKVFYDTSVMLRLLGCSGRELETATLEMHNSLIDLGCDLHYLDVNRGEVLNIFDSIINANAHGHEIFGETGEAIISGEITMGHIRDLSATFETRLGHLNVFPYDYNHGARASENAFQINELDFTEALVSAAQKTDKSYKRENALNDAKAVALVLRLRKGRSNRELSKCKFIFVSQNSLLQRTSRKFCTEHVQEYDESAVSPVITVGQITTAGWLATERALAPAKVSKELLANCYSAVQPSANWAEEFAKALEQFPAEDQAALAERADAALILKATRDAVRDQSLNEAAVLRKINVAEVFRQAAAKADTFAIEKDAEIEALRAYHADESERRLNEREASLAREHERQLVEAVNNAAQEAAARHATERSARNKIRANSLANGLTKAFTALMVITFFILLLIDKFNPFTSGGIASSIVASLVLIFGAIGILDFCGLKPITRAIDGVRAWISAYAFWFLDDQQLY